MDFGYTDSEQEFRAETREFLEGKWPPEVQSAGRATAEEGERFRRAAAEKGWFSLGLPEEYGGLPAFSQMERYIVSDEASRIGAPLPPYLVSIIGPLVIKHGTDWMKTEVLSKIGSGDMNFVLGFTEPETGSDLANLTTRAVRDGDEYVINGAKMYGNPGPGDVMYLAVRTDPDAPLRQGISVLFVEYGREGFTATQMPTLAGHTVGATFYDNVRVPVDHLLGEENKGWDYIREALDLDRTSGITYGQMPMRLAELVDYVKTSSLNGRPLVEDPWVRDRIAQFVIEIEAGELLQGMTAAKITAGLKLRMESSVVKIFLTELERRIGEFAMEVSGPLASLTPESEEAPSDGWFHYTQRNNPGITIAGGSNEIQRNIIALQGLGLPRD